MPVLRTTVGQLLVNEALPPQLRDYSRVLDKKTTTQLLRRVAEEHPDQYREVSHKLATVGWNAAQSTGGYSFGLKSLQRAKAANQIREQTRQQVDGLLKRKDLNDSQRDKELLRIVGKLAETQQTAIYDESMAEDNPLAYQVLSGARGNKMFLAGLRGGDMLYVDHRDRPIPFPVLSSYSQGLKPAEYWAGSYGARKGVVDTKTAVQDAGALSKQLNQAVHRQLVTAIDEDKPSPTLRGYPVDVSDDDNEGALLAADAGGYKRNTILTPKILAELRDNGVKRLLIRSPIAAASSDGGLYARDVGVREFGRLPTVGEQVSMAAAQALSEPLSQGSLSSKHSGGIAGAAASKAVSGFELVNQLVQVPRTFKGGAAHSTTDGVVNGVEDAPAGGKFVYIDGKRHYVHPDYELSVKRGDRVDAGDVISEGLPNPALIVEHKGLGEGRRYFVDAMRKAYQGAGMMAHRRNIELLARGLVNHVELTDEMDDGVPGDVMPYHLVESSYQPRPGFRSVKPQDAVGKYLERPYLHYSIGTKVRPRMLQDFQEFGIPGVDVHDEPPPFKPVMIRAQANLQHDPDWITRMYGSGQKATLLEGVQRGSSSDPAGTSFVPGLAMAENFGQSGKVRTPDPAPSFSVLSGPSR
jgi:hypothetical protein